MARVYTQDEKKFFYLQQVVHGLSGRETRDSFAALFPDRPIPSLITVQRVIHDFNTRGSIDGHNEIPRNVRARRVLTEELELRICAEMEIEPHTTSRQLSSECDVAQASVLKVLRKEKYKPYKLRHGQKLSDKDEQQRYEMAMYLIEKMEETNGLLFENILFSDECTFFLDGKRNVQMHRTWARENHFVHVTKDPQRPAKLNVWCGILNTHIIGPFFIEGNLTSAKYVNMLRNQIRPAIIAAVGEEGFLRTVYHQDGAGPHTAHVVRTVLDAMFPNRWIGKYSSFIEWAPRSPCLNPCDFFLWGYIKSKLYSYYRIETLVDLRRKIVDIIAGIPPEVLRKVVTSEFENRLRCCIAAEGEIFEYRYR